MAEYFRVRYREIDTGQYNSKFFEVDKKLEAFEFIGSLQFPRGRYDRIQVSRVERNIEEDLES